MYSKSTTSKKAPREGVGTAREAIFEDEHYGSPSIHPSTHPRNMKHRNTYELYSAVSSK